MMYFKNGVIPYRTFNSSLANHEKLTLSIFERLTKLIHSNKSEKLPFP